jgi:hypothetical protein
VTFLHMTKLASLLLFEYLDARKLKDTAVSGAKGGSSSPFHGFHMFVSSSSRVFSLTPADVPALGAKQTVLQGLRCLARLSAQAWMKTAREYVEEAAQAVEENGDICRNPEDLDKTARAFDIEERRRIIGKGHALPLIFQSKKPCRPVQKLLNSTGRQVAPHERSSAAEAHWREGPTRPTAREEAEER